MIVKSRKSGGQCIFYIYTHRDSNDHVGVKDYTTVYKIGKCIFVTLSIVYIIITVNRFSKCVAHNIGSIYCSR